MHVNNKCYFDASTKAFELKFINCFKLENSNPGAARATEEHEKLASALPTNFDWRDVNGLDYVSPVRNQGVFPVECWMCWMLLKDKQLCAQYDLYE